MIKNSICFFGLLISLAGCNLYSGLSSPSNDEQYLEAARGCLDRGDFDCALNYYKALSSSYNDIKVNETSLTTLAKNNIFSISDLIGSLGSSRGSGASFTSMANDLAARGAATAANRQIIYQTYLDNESISDSNPKLKAFSKFISAISMFNAVIGSAISSGSVLSASNLVANAPACLAVNTAGSNIAACDPPSGTALTDTSESITMGSNQDWSGTATIDKAIAAIDAADAQIATLTGTSSTGIFSAVKQLQDDLAGVSGSATAIARAKRNLFINFLFGH